MFTIGSIGLLCPIRVKQCLRMGIYLVNMNTCKYNMGINYYSSLRYTTNLVIYMI